MLGTGGIKDFFKGGGGESKKGGDKYSLRTTEQD